MSVKKRFFATILALLMTTPLFSACTSSDKDNHSLSPIAEGQENQSIENVISEINKNYTEMTSNTDTVLIAESNTMKMYLDTKKVCVFLVSKQTGRTIYTKLFNDENGTDLQKSDLNISYYTGISADKYSASSAMDTYKMSVELGNYKFYKIENGVRICYQLGDDSVSYADFPERISEERMEELVLQYLSSSEQKIVENTYRLLKSGVYVRQAQVDQPLSPLAGNELYHLFYEIGKYTSQELAQDNLEHGVEAVTGKQTIVVSIDYYFDDDDLMIRIPVSEMYYEEMYPIKSIEVLPYFLSTESTDGYLFVPDGSGALIYLDNDKDGEFQFTSRYYGGDALVNANKYESKIFMNMPIYGLKANDYAVLGIIEQGAEIASLSAKTRSYYTNEPYSRLTLSFDVKEQQKIAASNLAAYEFNRVVEKDYPDDIVIRYSFMEGDQANYVGMADKYSDYLVKNKLLKQNRPEENASIYVELLGMVDKTMNFLGIPYTGDEVLTSFDQASYIVEDLNSKDIENMKIEYRGIANGGLNQNNIKNVKLENCLGSKQDYLNFVDKVETLGSDVFSSFKFQTVNSQKNLTNSQLSFFLNGQIAQIFDFDLISRKVDEAAKTSTYLLRGSYMPEYIKQFAKSYDTLGLNNVASSDFYTSLIGNYKNSDTLLMCESIEYYNQAAKFLDDKYSLMLSNPLDKAYKYADYITDLPTESSGYKILDAEIPFMQLVLNGNLDYSTTALNTDTYDISEEFLRAIESKSSMKFRFTYADDIKLSNTNYDDIFMTQYDNWINQVSTYYKKYNAFYQAVKGADIVNHTIINRKNDTRIVEYSNGVKVLLNYSDSPQVIDGTTVEPLNFVIK